MGKQRFTQQQVLAAIAETKGLVYLAARKLGCDPETVQNYAKRYPKVRTAIDTARAEVVDVAEAALYKALLAGESWAVLFALKTQGKGRGYVERVESKVEVYDWRKDAEAAGLNPDTLVDELFAKVKQQHG